ncbi:hypothetical protein I3842_14G085300 [Carya illinoinensis]|uniref:Uncharacterized protein n=1 Tax=Carya illinoinensis TaxID=32201 RepID=A0A922ABU4_CARIL|nr:hypothetical protein I3842_14G085300 [Carya illinoinensis]
MASTGDLSAFREEMGMLNRLLNPIISQQQNLENLIKSMSEHLPSRVAKKGMPGTSDAATKGNDAALRELHKILTAKPSKLIKSLSTIKETLEEMNNAMANL